MRFLQRNWRLLLAAGLIGAQALVVAVGLWAPNVSPGYRSLFIDKTMMTTPYSDHAFVWPGPDLVPETAVPSNS